MGIQHILQDCWLQVCWPRTASQTPAEIDAEIREELEFHLEMRTQDNVRSGMSAEEARRDAQQRFGDFEVSRRACRQITMGSQLLLHRIQTGLHFVLFGAVVYLGLRLVDLQTTNRNQSQTLAAMTQQLQNAQMPGQSAAATIPIVQWKLGSVELLATEGGGTHKGEPAIWNRAVGSLEQPWSDWNSLEDTRHNF